MLLAKKLYFQTLRLTSELIEKKSQIDEFFFYSYPCFPFTFPINTPTDT